MESTKSEGYFDEVAVYSFAYSVTTDLIGSYSFQNKQIDHTLKMKEMAPSFGQQSENHKITEISISSTKTWLYEIKNLM